MMFPLTLFIRVPLKGKWIFLIVFVELHSLAMLGEEMMWRGYILPRQEAKFGKDTWVSLVMHVIPYTVIWVIILLGIVAF